MVFRNVHGLAMARFEGRFRGNVTELSGQHQAMGLAIDERTGAGGWDGERLDYDYILDVLFQHRDRDAATAAA